MSDKYDSLGRFVKSYVYDTETYYNLYESSVVYDDQSRISMVFHNVDYICPSTSYHGNYYYDSTFYSYSYDSVNGRLSSLSISSPSLSGYIDPVYDDLGRTTSKVINLNAHAFYNELSYEYVSAAENRQTGLVSAITSTIGSGENAVETKYQYTYDANGNITQIRENNVIQYRYQYDSLGQLVREDNRPLNYSYVYHYDNAGNLTSKVRYAFTTGALGSAQKTNTYTYGDATWGDLLTKFNWDEIEYDEIGNPIKIGSYNETEGIWDYYYGLEWEGRQLKSYEYFELYFDDVYYNENRVEFTYNADGIRTSKTVDGKEYRYLLNGSQIIGTTWKENGRIEHLLIYLYDENGSPIGLKFRKASYQSDVFDCFFFEKNLQGDIIAIYNASGTKIGTYTYDAWAREELEPGAEGLIQPTLWEHPSHDGRVSLLARSSFGSVYRSDSADFGRTWSVARPTDLPNNNSGLDVTQTPDGTLALIYNPVGRNWGPRSPISVSLSTDNGETWGSTVNLETLPMEFSYPAIVCDGNKLYMTYTWGRRVIAYVEAEIVEE